jgi:capsular polysaccharide biosynthesis protein
MSAALAVYGRILRARWRWLMWGVLLALTATTAFLVVSPPLYRSEATVFVRTPGDVSQVQDGGDSYAQGRAQTYAALVNSTSVAARVIADLGLDLQPEVLFKRISATHPTGTAVIRITLSAPSGEEAQRTLGVLLSEYAANVQTLESVPGSLVPRAELVVIDSPSPPTRTLAWGVPIALVLFAAILLGMVIASLAAVVAALSASPSRSAARASDAPIPVNEGTQWT